MAEEKERSQKGFSLLRLALFLLMVVMIAGVALYAFLDINPADMVADGLTGLYNRVFAIGKARFSEKVKELASYDPNERLYCATVSDDLAVASVSSLKLYDTEGREKWYVPVNLKKPFIQANKNEILVADLEGRYFALVRDGRILWEKSIDEDIVNASFSENWVLVITKSKLSGYKRTIYAYSPDGEAVSFRNVSNYYPFFARNYPEYDPNSFIACGVEASGLQTNSLFEFLNPSMNQKGSIRGEKEILAGGIPLEKQTLLLYGEKSLVCVDQGLKTLWRKSFPNSSITGVSAISRKFPVVAELNQELFSREKRHETTVRILDGQGAEKARVTLDSLVTRVDSEGRTASVLAGSEVYFINEKGEIMDRYTARSGVEGVYLAREDLAYVLSGGIVTRVKVKVTNRFLGIF